MKKIFSLIWIIVILINLNSCKKDNLKTKDYGIDPTTEQDMLNRALRIDGKLNDGEMPKPTGNGSLLIEEAPNAVEVSAGVYLFIPFKTNNNSKICKIFLQVIGAESYWEVHLKIDSSSSNPYIEVFIPNFVKDGHFDLRFSVADCDGNISSTVITNTVVTPPLGCGDGSNGAVGITVLHYSLGDNSGTVSIDYDMYQQPDRIDVRYNNKWIASSGTLLANTSLGPNCSLDGFVSNTHTITFSYSPGISKDLYIYVTGCVQGTLWKLNVDCP